MAATIYTTAAAEAKVERFGKRVVLATFNRPWANSSVTVKVPRSRFPRDMKLKKGDWFHIWLHHIPHAHLNNDGSRQFNA